MLFSYESLWIDYPFYLYSILNIYLIDQNIIYFFYLKGFCFVWAELFPAQFLMQTWNSYWYLMNTVWQQFTAPSAQVVCNSRTIFHCQIHTQSLHWVQGCCLVYFIAKPRGNIEDQTYHYAKHYINKTWFNVHGIKWKKSLRLRVFSFS